MKSFKQFANKIKEHPVAKAVSDHPIAKKVGEVAKKVEATAIKHERKTRIPMKATHPFKNKTSTKIRKETEKASGNFARGAVAAYTTPISQTAAVVAGSMHPALAIPAFGVGHAAHYGLTGIFAAKAARRKQAAEKLKNRETGGSISSKFPDRTRQSTKYEE